MSAELRNFLHELINATAGEAAKVHLHGLLEAVEKAAPVVATVAEDVVKAAPLL